MKLERMSYVQVSSFSNTDLQSGPDSFCRPQTICQRPKGFSRQPQTLPFHQELKASTV